MAASCSGEAVSSYADVTLGDERAPIGVAEGPPELTLGGVDDLVPGPNGDVFILDAKSVQVRRFSGSGEALAARGRNVVDHAAAKLGATPPWDA